MADRARVRGLSYRSLEPAAQVFRLLGHPVRLKLVERLLRGEAHVTALARHTGRSQHDTSQHLMHLHLHGLLSRRRHGRRVYYRIRDPHLMSIFEWVHKRAYLDATYRDGEAI